MKLTDMLPPEAFAVNNSMAPKLSFFDRCVVYGLWVRGMSKRVLAAAFGVNRSTIAYITNPSSAHYRNVRREFRDLGDDRFHSTYTDSNEAKARWYEKLRTAALSSAEDTKDEDQASVVVDNVMRVANKSAKSHEGGHAISAFFGTAVFSVVWTEDMSTAPADEVGAVREPGWYVTVSADAVGFLAGVPYGLNADRFTSKQALTGFLKQVEGEVI